MSLRSRNLHGVNLRSARMVACGPCPGPRREMCAGSRVRAGGCGHRGPCLERLGQQQERGKQAVQAVHGAARLAWRAWQTAAIARRLRAVVQVAMAPSYRALRACTGFPDHERIAMRAMPE
jgi:hypothetical protein